MSKIIIGITCFTVIVTLVPNTIAETYTLHNQVMGCSTIETYEEALEYVQKNDREAFKKMFGLGPCQLIDAGVKFDVYRRSKQGDYTLMEIRPYGKRFKLWIMERAMDIE